MDVSVISQGRRMETSTISNSLSNQEVIDVSNTSGDSSIQPIERNQNIGREMQHDQKNFSENEVKKAVDKLNKFLQGEETHVVYERHEMFKNEFVIKIVNNETKEVIKEIPPKKILDMVAEMCRLAGVIFDKKA